MRPPLSSDFEATEAGGAAQLSHLQSVAHHGRDQTRVHLVYLVRAGGEEVDVVARPVDDPQDHERPCSSEGKAAIEVDLSHDLHQLPLKRAQHSRITPRCSRSQCAQARRTEGGMTIRSHSSIT